LTRITTVINQKGGVGKTTTAHALATGLIHRGRKTLIIDTDPQGNITYAMRADAARAGLYEAMRGEISAADAIQRTDQGDIMPSSLYLAGADLEFTQTGREYLLRELLEGIAGNYTHIIIDSPPALGIMTINALTASNDIVIPVGADIFSLQGLQQLLSTVDKVKKYSNPALILAGVLITRKGQRAIATKQLIEAIQERAAALNAHLYRATIREAIAIKEAQIMQSSIFDSHAKAKATADYKAFIDEYLAQEAYRA